jgi:predicted Na+-dependent transporter
MMAFPAAAFGLTSLLWPEWALPVLVLTAVSTGVSAPFFCQVLGGNAERMLQVVVVTSLLVPVCMPLTLQLLAGTSIKVPFMHMFELLAKMIFIPLALAGGVRWLSPRLGAGLSRAAFPISICLMLLINAGVFAMCVDLFKTQKELIPLSILLATAVALFAQVFGAGAALGTLGRMNPYTSMISLNFGNNLIAVIFAAQFFDGKAPLLAAIYTLPLFLGLISIRSFSWVQRLKISRPDRAGQQ